MNANFGCFSNNQQISTGKIELCLNELYAIFSLLSTYKDSFHVKIARRMINVSLNIYEMSSFDL